MTYLNKNMQEFLQSRLHNIHELGVILIFVKLTLFDVKGRLTVKESLREVKLGFPAYFPVAI